MNFTPKNLKGFQALQKDILYELEMLQTKYKEILETGSHEKARRFISYKSLMNIEKFRILKVNVILFFILRLRDSYVSKSSILSIKQTKEENIPLNDKQTKEESLINDKQIKEESLTVKNFFKVLNLSLEDLVTKTTNNTEYDLIYAFIDLLIKTNNLLEAKKLLNTIRKNKWISVKYFKYQKLIERNLKASNFH